MNSVPAVTDSSTPSIQRRGVVAVLVRGDQFLMIRRSLTVRAPGMYCFPGGTIEADESQPAALRRELREELGIEIEPVRPLWNCVTDWGTELSWWLSVWPAAGLAASQGADNDETATAGLEWEANPAEVAWCGWMTVEQILAEPDLLSSNRRFFECYLGGNFDLRISG